MTKKDYELIAQIIKTTMSDVKDSGLIETSEQATLVSTIMAKYLLKNIITEFIENYDNFDVNKFSKAVSVADQN
tara:strand:- start:213 stop:434 length:222 start_codon:yes stop_codon:yes gene_type:complete